MIPQAWARPRVSRIRNKPVFFTASHVRHAQLKIKTAFRTVFKDLSPLENPVGVHLVFYFPKSRGARNHLKYFPAKRPDIDNCAKLIADSMNGIILKDDALICALTVQKRYADEDNDPGVYCFIEELSEEENE